MRRRCAFLCLYLLTLDFATPLLAQAPDTDPPVIRILVDGSEMTEGSRYKEAVEPVVEVTDASALQGPVVSKLDGVDFTSGSTVSNEGQYTLSVSATDVATNAASRTVHFEIDTTPPQITSVQPQDGSLLSAAQVVLQGEVSGATALTVDGVPVELIGGHFVSDSYPLPEGARTWDLVATDAAGNQTTRTHRLVRDATVPVLTLGQPAQGDVRGASPIAVVGTVRDTHAVTVTVNGTAATITGTTWVVPNLPLAEGATLLTVEARDAAGNLSTATRTVGLDTQPPAVAITDPAQGTVVPGASIAVSGSVADPHLDRVEVNGVRATVTNGTWTATVPLAEGNNNLVARAYDTLDHSAADTVAVQRDSKAPAIQIAAPEEGSWWSATTVAVSGTVEEEPGLAVTVNGGPATLTAGSFAAAAVALAEGENRLIARVTDHLGNQGAHTRLVYRDTVAPRLVASDPSAGALALPLDAAIELTFSEPLRTPLAAGAWRLETAAGQPLAAVATVSGSAVTIRADAALPSRTDLRLVLTTGLVDRAGNALAAPPALTFTTADREAPATPVLSAAPAAFTCGPRLALSGAAEAEAVIEVTGGASGAQTRADASGAFSLTVELRAETLNRLEIAARDRDGNRSAPLAVEVVHDCAGPRVAGAELASGVFQVTFSEKIDPASLSGAVRVFTATAPIAGSVAAAGGGTGAVFTPSSALPEEPLRLEVGTGVRDLAGNALTYPYSRVFGTGVTQSFLSGRVIDNETGRPLPGAVVVVVASNGTVTPEPQPEQTTGADGRFSLPVAPGTHTLLVARGGYTPSLRSATVAGSAGTDVFDPRLTPAAEVKSIPASGGTWSGEGGLALVIPDGALSAPATVAVTALEEQGLPALLPYGWSPRGAAWVDLGGASLSASATLTLPVAAPDNTSLALVRLDLNTLQWHVVDVAPAVAGRVTLPVSAEGGWAAVEADPGATAPPVPVIGAVLGSATAGSAASLTAASLAFHPATVLPSQRSVGTVTYTVSGEAPPSGLPLTLDIREELTLLDGTVRKPGPYEADLVVYRAPAPAGGLRSRFGLRPSVEAQSSPLQVGSEGVVIRTYASETVRGNVLGPQGGSVLNDDGDQVTIPVGGLLEPTAVSVTRRAAGDLPRPVPAGTAFLGLLDLDLSGRVLTAPAQLTLDLKAAPAAGATGLLFQAVNLGSGALWRPVVSLAATATGWTTAAIDPDDLPWSGVREGGSYLFAELTTPVGYLRGTVFGVDGGALAGALVSSTAVGWIQLSNGGDGNGRYVLPAPVGSLTVVAEDRATADAATAITAIPSADARVSLDLLIQVTGPRALEFNPVSGSTNVLPGVEPTIRFSEPVDPATLAAGILLQDGATTIPVTLEATGTLVRVRPRATLRPGATHELRVNTAVRDLQGHRLEQAVTATFVILQPQISTQLDLRRVHLLEPVNGVARVVARAGAVPAGSTVIVERTTGSASTVTGTAAQDGTFELSIPATLADTLLLHVLREGQNEIIVELTPFLTTDGRAAYVDEAEAVTFTTLDGITVKIEEGTFLEPAVVRVDPVTPADVRVTAPADLPVVYAYRLDFGGVEARKALQVTVPTPAGVTGDDFLLGRVETVFGQRSWMLYDLMRRDGARITTELLPDELSALFGPQAVAVLASLAQRLPEAGEPRLIAAGSRRGDGKEYLPGSANPGLYVVMDVTTPLDFVAFPAFAGLNALFFQTGIDGCVVNINSHIANLLAFDAVLLPVRRGQPYTIVGRDLTTGYRIFQQTFAPPAADGEITKLPPDLLGDRRPPAPVGGSPLRFHLFTAGPAGVQELEPGVEVEIQDGAPGQATLTFRGEAGAVEPDIQIRLLGLDDTASASVRSGSDGAFTLIQTVAAGKRYLLATGAVVGAGDALEIAFSEALINGLPGIEVVDAQGKNVQPEILPVGSRETVRISPRPSWKAGATYRLRLKNDLTDAAGNRWNRLLELEFKVEASDVLDTYELPVVREVARLGSLLFVAAEDKGLVVLDASDPAHLKNVVSGPVDVTFPFPLNDAVRGVTIDSHGRVLVVGGGVKGFGQMKIFDPLALDPAAIAANPNDAEVRYAAFKGSSLLSDRLGVDSGTSLPEGTPARVTVLSDDDTIGWRIGVDAAPAGITVTPAPPASGAETLVTVSGSNGTAGLPVTFRNISRGRWDRVDAGSGGSWQVQLSVRAGDRVEVSRNRRSLAYVATAGVGIQVADVNAFYNEDPGNADPEDLESDLLGIYTGIGDPDLTLCGQEVSDIGGALLDVATLYEPGDPHPLTVVGLVGRRGLALFESNPANVGSISAFNDLCLEVEGSTDVAGMEVLPNYAFDDDGDGTLEESEESDYIVVAHRKGVLIVDAGDRDNLELVGWIRLGGGQAARVSVDRERRRIYVAGQGGGLYVVDFDRKPTTELLDLNQDGLDDRLIETIALPGISNAPVLLLPELGIAYAGGRDRGLTSVAVGQPLISAITQNRGPQGGPQKPLWRGVDRLAPLGVPTAPESALAGAPDLPASFRLLASLPGVAGDEVRLDLVSLGAADLPVTGAGDLADLPQPALEGATDGVVLRRMAENPWEEGYQLYLSDEIVAVADLRASAAYTRTAGEDEPGQCLRCKRADLAIPEDALEILSGRRIAVRIPEGLRTSLGATYEGRRLGAAELTLASTPWDLASAVRQEPALNASLGMGGAVPGTLLHSGEMSLTATDLVVQGRGFGFAFTRFYRSQALGAGPLGPGWDHLYNQRLRELPDGSVHYFDGRGRRELFQKQADGTLKPPAGRFVTLERNSSGWLLIDAAHNIARFDRFGRLISLADAVKDSAETGNEMLFAYDLASRLTRVTDSLDREYLFTYDGEGRLEKLKDFTGREVTYEYDSAGRLISVTSPKVETGESTFANGLVTRYEYASSTGSLAQALRSRDNLTALRDPKNQERFQLTYTGEEVTAQEWGTGTVQIAYDFTARRTTITDRRGHVSLVDHDAAGHPTRVEDARHAVTTYAYNQDGLVTSATEPLGRVTTHTYDATAERRGQANATQVSVTADSRGANGSAATLTTTFEYEPRTNQPTRIVDPRGAVTRITRDSVGLPTSIVRAHDTAIASETKLSYNDFGQPVEVTDPEGRKTRFSYFADGESRGYLESTTVDPGGLGITTRYRTDERGNILAVTDPRGVRSERTLNELDMVVEERQAVTGAAGAPALGYKTVYLYDANGNLTELRLPYGDAGESSTKQTFTYGQRDELLTAGSEIEPGGAMATVTRVYDENLNVTRVEDPEGRATEIIYDERDQAVSVTQAAGTAEAVTEQLAYDLEGQRISHTDARAAVWSTTYDGFGRVKESADPLGNWTTVTYDNGSLPAAVKSLDDDDVLLAESRAVHDLLGRRTTDRQMLFAVGQPTARALESRIEYDRAGNPLRLIDPLSRVTELTYDPAGRLLAQVDPIGNRTQLQLDAAGNVTKTTTTEVLPGGGTTVVETAATYDALGRPLLMLDGLGNTWRSLYDARGNVRTTIDPENFITAYQYDGLGRLVHEAHPEGVVITRGYDKTSRQVSYRDAKNQMTSTTYDALGRPRQTTYPDATTELLTFDAAGNLEQIRDANGTVVTQTYDAAGRMITRSVLAATNVEASSAETYEYDGLGRLIRLTTGSRVTALQYDSLSRLLEELTPDGAVRYAYNDVGSPTSVFYPSGLELAQSFDALDRPVSIAQMTLPPPTMPGRTAAPSVQPLVSYTYRGASLLAGKTLANGVTGTWQFDAARRPVNAAFSSPLGEIYQETTSWNPRGLKVAQSRGDQNGAGFLLAYDGAGRLVQSAQVPATQAAAPNNSVVDPATLSALPEGVGFTYDAAQNLLARTVKQAGAPKTEAMPLDASGRNRPASVNGKPLEWDANGNLVRKGDQRFQYDDRNRLTKVMTLAGSELATYRYDSFNRRIGRTVGAETHKTVWSGWQAIEEYKNGALASRRTYGQGLDEIVRLENDLDGDGTPETSYAPVYDSTGNLVALTGAQGKPIERYLYDPYGKQTILVDSLPPVVEQVRVKDGALWLEISEEVDSAALTAAVTAGHLTLTTEAGGTPIPLTVTQPVQEGLQAGRRVVLTPATAPVVDSSYELVIQPDALVDSFLNRPAAAIELTFNWPAGDAVVQDTVAPRVEQVLVREGRLEVQLSEEPDLTAASAALQVNGQALTWTLGNDGYTLKSVPAYEPGTYSLTISTGALDLAGLGLAEAVQEDVTVSAGLLLSVVSRRPEPRQISVSAAGNPYGFQGLPLDTETGLLYVRNRYYDPEMGRFISVDPLGYVDGPNAYGFVKNDPVNGRDPLGLETLLQNTATGREEIWDGQQLYRQLVLVEGLDPREASRIVIATGMGADIGALSKEDSKVLNGYIVAAGELSYQLILGSAASGLTGGVAGASGFGWFSLAVVEGAAGGLGSQAGYDLAVFERWFTSAVMEGSIGGLGFQPVYDVTPEVSRPCDYVSSMAWSAGLGVGLGVGVRGVTALARPRVPRRPTSIRTDYGNYGSEYLDDVIWTVRRRPSGADAHAKGIAREQYVADLVGGRVSGERIKNAAGGTDIDVVGPLGELISVGGPAKANPLSKFGSHLKTLRVAAESRGVAAKMYLEKGTPQSVVDLAIRHLGKENVVIFPPIP